MKDKVSWLARFITAAFKKPTCRYCGGRVTKTMVLSGIYNCEKCDREEQ